MAKKDKLIFNTNPVDHGGYWGEHPDWSVEDWKLDVKYGNTRRGYWDWVKANAAELQQRENLRATGGKVFKFAIQWEGKTHRFESKRAAITWIERNFDETFKAWEAENKVTPG